MRVFIKSKGWVILVARRPAIAPEGILSNGPDEGEFNGDARISPPSYLKHTQSASYIGIRANGKGRNKRDTSNESFSTLIKSKMNPRIRRISQRRGPKSTKEPSKPLPLKNIPTRLSQ